ncbi:hypothetical protein ACKP2L_07400 [Oenococcus alcoholitolerans]|uniref:hypothetical protein n=1 Tax=Oenococcus alcoholitolerans TaxID=931074 RepID=UPI003F7029D9
MGEFGIFQSSEILEKLSDARFVVSGKTANEKELQDLPFNEDYQRLFSPYDEITVRPDGQILEVYKGEKPSYDCA